ncbi:hypothetical protein FRC09_019255 [Ceratobasidium sp. 395]|nr:hypothetical protein FRC09_019255 [Ceratobasidium sp. 395]
MQLHNKHERLVKRLLPRFSPTWLGDPEPQPTNSSPGISAVGPPAAVTTSSTPAAAPTPTPTPTPAAPTPSPVPTTSLPVSVPAQVSVPTTTTPSTTDVVQTTTTPQTSSTDLVSSTTPATTTAPTTSSTPVQPTTTSPRASVAQTTAPPASITNRSTLQVKSYTNASGGIIYSTLFEAPQPTASAPATPSNTGTIVGAVAGSLVGIVCLIAFVSWLIRLHNKRKRGSSDDFDRQSYLRNSMMIPDDTPGAGRPVIGTQAALALARANMGDAPRPPTMIERKPTYLMNGQPSPSYSPGQVVSFDPGQVVPAPPSAGNGYPSPMAFAAYTPPGEHHQTELSRRPSGAQLLTRQPTNGGMYEQVYQNSPVGYSPDGYHTHGGYTYPMQANREMIQSVTPFQAEQYAEITRQLNGHPADIGNDSFHPISPVSPAPIGYAITDEPEPVHGGALPNPFDEKAHARIDSTPPSLPPIGAEEGRLSRTGTPIDPNPQHAHWSYDAKAGQPGTRLSVAGMPIPSPAPTIPSTAYTREDRTVVVGNGEAMPARGNAKRPVSIVDEDDVYGGM